MSNFGFSEEFLHHVPSVMLPQRIVGGSGYVDNIEAKDFGPYNVIKGKDHLNRNFVSAKLHVRDINDKEYDLIYTVFQRYIDSTDSTVFCKSHRSPSPYRFIEEQITGGVLRMGERLSQLLRDLETEAVVSPVPSFSVSLGF